jgi:hypothetical protein
LALLAVGCTWSSWDCCTCFSVVALRGLPLLHLGGCVGSVGLVWGLALALAVPVDPASPLVLALLGGGGCHHCGTAALYFCCWYFAVAQSAEPVFFSVFFVCNETFRLELGILQPLMKLQFYFKTILSVALSLLSLCLLLPHCLLLHLCGLLLML